MEHELISLSHIIRPHSSSSPISTPPSSPNVTKKRDETPKTYIQVKGIKFFRKQILSLLLFTRNCE